MPQSITVHSRWRGKQTPIEVTVTRVTFRTVSYIALDKTISVTLPQWLFLQFIGTDENGRETASWT